MRHPGIVHRVLTCVAFATALSIPMLAQPDVVTRDAPFANGGVVILDANIGDVRVMPESGDDHVRLVIESRKPDDHGQVEGWVREFSVNGSQAKITIQTPKMGSHEFTVKLYVPRKSDLRLHLEVGDLTVERISGNTDANVGVGDLKVMVNDIHAYRAVDLSTRIGDVRGSDFGLSASGFLRSVSRTFPQGSYHLKLHTGIGDVVCGAAGS